MLLPFRHYRHHFPCLRLDHASAWTGEAWTHDVRSSDHEADGASVHLHVLHHEGVLVQDAEMRDQWAVSVLQQDHSTSDGVDTDVGVAAAKVILHDRSLTRKDFFEEGLDGWELGDQSIAKVSDAGLPQRHLVAQFLSPE